MTGWTGGPAGVAFAAGACRRVIAIGMLGAALGGLNGCGRAAAPAPSGGGLAAAGSGPGAAAAVAGAPPGPAAASADPYLGLVLQDPHGRSLRLGDFKGQVRVFDLWATWCGPCRETIPQLNAIYERYRERGLVVVGMVVDDRPAQVVEFERRNPIRYPTGMFRPEAAALLGEPSAVPTTFLIDRAGTIRKTFQGFVDSETLEKEILGLL